jgi:hypothetical protein
MEIWYTFTPSRDVAPILPLQKLDVNQVISEFNDSDGISVFSGLYNLKLPVANFASKGIYNLVIRPREIKTTITDCGVLSAFPDIKGILIDLADIPPQYVNKFENNNLIGYRIEYLNTNTNVADVKIRNFFKVVTSNNRAEPVNQNLTNTNQKAIRYNFNDNSTLVFCTVSPSSTTNVKPNVLPFIGQPNQEIIITNTYFNPLMIEIEMVEHDIETLAFALFGNQSKSLEDGIYTIYNFTNQIYKQYNLYEVKDQFSGKPLFEVREQRNNIDFSKNFNNIRQA